MYSGPALPPLDMQLLADLPSLELKARYMIDGFLAGRHRSPQKGSSVEFAEYRAYQSGDDLRRVDWRLYARADRLHLKQYEEETRLHVYLVLDTSQSMNFQSRPGVMSKIAFARLALAAIGLAAQRQGDAFGLALVGSEIQDYLRARSSLPHWRSFAGRMECVKPGGPTRLAKCLADLAELIPPRSMIVIASDFYEDTPLLGAALRRLRYDHHDLIGLHVLDPVEIDFDLEQTGHFLDVEDGRRLRVDAGAVREGYLGKFSAFCRDLDDLFHQAGGDATRLRTDASPINAIAGYLSRRSQSL